MTYYNTNYNTTLLPNVITITVGMFCDAKYTHHTFMPIVKHQYSTTTANSKHLSKKSFINKYMKNPMRNPSTHIYTM